MYIKERKYSEEQIEAVSKLLQYKDKKEITKRLKCHRNHVYRVFKGDYYDELVVNEALNIIAERTEYQASVAGVLDEAIEYIQKIKLAAKL